MISSLLLEKEGKWRSWGSALILALALLPAAPLLWRTTFSASESFSVGTAFGSALLNSTLVALATMVISLAAGLPLGVLSALYQNTARKTLLTLAALPLIVPSFLWAIGWSMLAGRLHPSVAESISGFPGCILVFSALGTPLVLFTAYLVTARLSASQVEAARLAGGEDVVINHALRYAFQPSLMAAGLAAVLTLSDAGPGFIFGLRTAASEILTSFSVLYDFGLAGRQSVTLALIVLLLSGPLAAFAAPRLSAEISARQLRHQIPIRHSRLGTLTVAGLLTLLIVTVLLPLAGLSWPLAEMGTNFERAFSEALRTAANTFFYAAGSGIVAVVSAMLLAFCVGRQVRIRTICLAALIVLFALPPVLAALGLIYSASNAPAWMDPVLRSRISVALTLGFRFLPVAAVLAFQAWAATSPTWNWAAAVHGLPLLTYLRRVFLPLIRPNLTLAALLVALLATADVGTTLLLHPPGQPSFPLVIFMVMANAPQTLVASLCFLYIAGAAVLLLAVAAFPGGRKR